MAGIQIFDWSALGWAKLGDSGDQRTKALSEVLKRIGEYEIKRDSDFTWCKLKRKDISFFRLLASISQDNYTDERIYQSISSSKPGAEFIHTGSEEEVGKLAERIQKADEPLHKYLYTVESLLGAENYDKLPDLIRDIIAPFFFRDHPDGRIYFIVISDLLVKLLAHIRIPYICSIYGLPTARDMSLGVGIRAFDELTGPIAYLRVLVSILPFLFFPRFHFFSSTRLGSCMLFQLDKPFEFNPKYPYDLFDSVKPREIFDETVDINLGNIQRGSAEEERLAYRRFVHKKDWTSNELEIFVQWYIQKIDEMFCKFLDPTNFIDSKSDSVSFTKQFNFLHTVQRILIETSVIMTERDHQVRKPLFFELLDKYGTVLKDRADDRDKHKKNDAENFKTLLKITNYEQNIKPIIQGIPEPFGSYFAEDFGQTIFEEIHRVVIEDKYLASRISGDSVNLISWDESLGTFIDRGETQTKEEYVVNMLRTVRNTHHGYLDDPRNRFEKFLSIHSGSTPHYIADLSQLFVLSMLSDPSSLLNSQWI